MEKGPVNLPLPSPYFMSGTGEGVLINQTQEPGASHWRDEVLGSRQERAKAMRNMKITVQLIRNLSKDYSIIPSQNRPGTPTVDTEIWTF